MVDYLCGVTGGNVPKRVELVHVPGPEPVTTRPERDLAPTVVDLGLRVKTVTNNSVLVSLIFRVQIVVKVHIRKQLLT